jgi:hypothetical protein
VFESRFPPVLKTREFHGHGEQVRVDGEVRGSRLSLLAVIR